MITVQDMMTANPVTLSRYDSLHDARQTMQKNRFRHIPIVDENKQLIGLVTQRNVFASGISMQDRLPQEELSKIETGTLLADIMSTELVTITPEVKIADAAHIIHKKKFGCLPVVDSNNQLIGIITDHDFVAITIQLLDMMDASEPLEEDYQDETVES